jgi:plastocyanin
MRLRVTLACLCTAALAGTGATPALGVERIDAAFLSEYSAEGYTIDQGEIVTFGNRDKFLSHGLVSDSGGLFSAPVITWGQVRLLRGAPFLTTGSYPFHCPIHAGMTSVLNVSAAGAPLPADTITPTSVLKAKTGSLARLTGKGKLRVVVNPSEAVDAVIKASAAGVDLARIERTYVTPGRRAITIKVERSATKALRRAVARVDTPRLGVRLTISDVAGNSRAIKASRRLAVPRKPKGKRGKKPPQG